MEAESEREGKAKNKKKESEVLQMAHREDVITKEMAIVLLIAFGLIAFGLIQVGLIQGFLTWVK